MPPQNFSSETPKVMASILAGHACRESRFQGQGMAEESSKKLTCRGPIQLDFKKIIENSIEISVTGTITRKRRDKYVSGS